jgi:hypothetical protein
MHDDCREEVGFSFYANSRGALNEHLKTVHPHDRDYFLEFFCRNGDLCHGIAGACGYNHGTGLQETVPYSDIQNGTFVANGGCRNEKIVPNGTIKRCSRVFCRYNHGRGRVKWLLEQQRQKLEIPDVIDGAELQINEFDGCIINPYVEVLPEVDEVEDVSIAIDKVSLAAAEV